MIATTHGISEIVIEELSKLVADQMGLYFPPERHADLASALKDAAPELGFEDGRTCADRLLSSKFTKKQIAILASHLAVGETHFFRDKKQFDALETEILPDLINARTGGQQYLRIWSAGCSTGEEPYSIAIVVHRLIPDLKEWNITILATDINPRFLEKARCGIYRKWSFRSAPSWLQSQYFTRTSESDFEIRPEIRRMVTYSYLNLAEECFPSIPNNTNAMDVIFCRNVTMYFKPDKTRQISRCFNRAVIDGGRLIVSPSEAAQEVFADFSVARPSGAIIFAKDGAHFPRSELGVLPSEALAMEGPSSAPSAIVIPPTNQGSSTLVGRATVDKSGMVQGRPSDVRVPRSVSSYELEVELYEKGAYREALECVLGCSDEASDPIEHYILAARACANLGEFQEAVSWCDKALARDKMRAALYYLKAAILQAQNRSHEAVEALGRVLYLEPEFILAHFMLGNLSLNEGRQNVARKHFANTLDLLGGMEAGEILPESDGLTAGRLKEIVGKISECRLQNAEGTENGR